MDKQGQDLDNLNKFIKKTINTKTKITYQSSLLF